MSLFEQLLEVRGLTGEKRASFLSPEYEAKHDPFFNGLDESRKSCNSKAAPIIVLYKALLLKASSAGWTSLAGLGKEREHSLPPARNCFLK